MDSGHHQEKCSCDKTDTSLESDSSNSESPQISKEKRSKIGLFNLRRNRALHFNSKRSKKSSQAQCSSSSPNSIGFNPVKKSPKWSIKFNCTGRKESKIASQDTRTCCKCSCFKSLDEAGSSMVITEDSNPSPQSTSSEERSTRSSSDGELCFYLLFLCYNFFYIYVDGISATCSIPEQSNQPRPNQEIPQAQIEQAEGVRGIYGTAMSGNGTPANVVISAPFADSPWYVPTLSQNYFLLWFVVGCE